MFKASDIYDAARTRKLTRSTWKGAIEFPSKVVVDRKSPSHFSNYLSANFASAVSTPHHGYYDSATGVYFLIKSSAYSVTQAPTAVTLASDYACSSTDGVTWISRSAVANGRYYYTTMYNGRPYTRSSAGAYYGSDAVATTSAQVGTSAPTYFCRPVWFDNKLICGNYTGFSSTTPLCVENPATAAQTPFTALGGASFYVGHAASPTTLVYVGRSTATGGLVLHNVNAGSTTWNTGRIDYGKYINAGASGYTTEHIPIDIVWTGTNFLLFVAMFYNSTIRINGSYGHICSRISVFDSPDGKAFTHISDIKITDYYLNNKFSVSNDNVNYAHTDFSFDISGSISCYRNKSATVSNGRVAIGVGIYSRYLFGVANANDSAIRYCHPALLYSLDNGLTWSLTELTQPNISLVSNGPSMLAFTDLIATPDGFMGFYRVSSSNTALNNNYLITNPDCVDIVI